MGIIILTIMTNVKGFIHLFHGRVIDRERGWDQERLFICSFIPEMVVMAGTGSD